MSYDLAVWVGKRPATYDVWESLASRYENNPEPPDKRIVAFVETLLAKWPDLNSGDDEGSPWCDGSLMSSAVGEYFYCGLVFSAVNWAVPFIAQTAQEHGLVCFDRQAGMLLPATPEQIDQYQAEEEQQKINGQLEEIDVSKRTVDFYRHQVRRDPKGKVKLLAVALANYANKLLKYGQPEQALAPAKEALALRRNLARGASAGEQEDLKRSLQTYADCLSALGQHDEEKLIQAELAQQ
jgi:hypothetical protein